MRKGLLILLFIPLSLPLCAQKELLKQWDATPIDTIYLHSDVLSVVRIRTAKTDVISVRAVLAGELAQETMLNERREGRTLDLSTGLAPYFEPENDKLAAHKVLSVDMEINLPERKAVVVYSRFGSVRASGNYTFFEVGLENGNCMMRDFRGDTRLYTVNGDIEVGCLPGVSGRANSKYGQTVNSLPEGYPELVNAESIYGDIRLSPVQ